MYCSLPEVPIHTAVDGIRIVMWAHSFLIEPGPTKMISHFIHHGWIKGLGPRQDVSSGAKPSRPCPYHRYTSSTPPLHFPEQGEPLKVQSKCTNIKKKK